MEGGEATENGATRVGGTGMSRRDESEWRCEASIAEDVRRLGRDPDYAKRCSEAEEREQKEVDRAEKALYDT